MGRKQKPRRVKPTRKPNPQAPQQQHAETDSSASARPKKARQKRGTSKASANPLGLWVWLPALLGFALYANTLGHGFTIDDGLVHTDNRFVQNGEFGEILSNTMIWGATNNNDGLYRPLSQLMFAAEVQLFGPDAGAGHFVNVLLLALTGWLIVIVLLMLLPNAPPWLALATALLFVAHPVHTEAVANIKGRDEILALLNFLAATWFLLRYYDTKKISHSIAGAGFFFLALLSKESALTFIVIFPLLLAFFRNADLKTAAVQSAPYVGVLVIWGAIRQSVISGMGQDIQSGVTGLLNNSLFGAESYIEQFATACWLQIMYLGKMVFPHPLLHDHSFNQVPVIGFGEGKAIGALLVLLGLAFVIFRFWKTQRILVFGLIFYFVGLAVVSNVAILIGSTFAERFLYASSFGFLLALAWGLSLLAKNQPTKGNFNPVDYLKNNPIYAVALGVLVLGFGAKTIDRNADWESNLTLFSADIPHLQESARAQYNYGTALMESAQDLNDGPEKTQTANNAITSLAEAIRIYPDYYDAYLNLGMAQGVAGNREAAIAAYDALLQKKADFRKALFNKGITYAQMERYNEAFTSWQTYIQYNPDDAQAYFLAGDNLGRAGRFTEAADYLRQCLALDPNKLEARIGLAQSYGMVGQNDQVISTLLPALSLPNGGTFDVYHTLGIAYGQLGDFPNSVKYFEQALALSPGNRDLMMRLALAYENSGNSAKAAQLRQQAGQ